MPLRDLTVSAQGKWIRVPALEVCGQCVVTKGGWIKTASVHDEFWLERGVEDPDPYVNALNDSRRDLPADIFTFAQRPPDVTPRYRFAMEWDSVAAIRLDDPKAWWDGLPQEARKNVRRAAKRGVTTSITTLNEEMIRGIVAINDESPMRQGKPFAHYGKTFEQVKQDYSSFQDRAEFICAHFEGELIGFIQLVYMKDSAHILEILNKEAHYDKRSANLLIEKAVMRCAEKGMSHLIYGKYRYGKKGTQNPLTEFKRRNGFVEYNVPRYYVPLTTKGRLCTALKLHRGLLEMLPERVISRLLAVRRMWYRSTLVRRPV